MARLNVVPPGVDARWEALDRAQVDIEQVRAIVDLVLESKIENLNKQTIYVAMSTINDILLRADENISNGFPRREVANG